MAHRNDVLSLEINWFQYGRCSFTDLDRLSTLVAIIAIAFAWAYHVGIDKYKNINL